MPYVPFTSALSGAMPRSEEQRGLRRVHPIGAYRRIYRLWRTHILENGDRKATADEKGDADQVPIGSWLQDSTRRCDIVIHNNSMASKSSSGDSQIENSSLAIPDSTDHPSRGVDEIGFISLREPGLMRDPTCQWELGQNVDHWHNMI